MDKMTFKTKDIANENVQKIASMFPSVMSEGKVDFEKLRQELSNEVIDGDECYDFTWVGKKAAMVEANKPTTKTLRPCKEESVNFDTTENLYIEGDNLEVLKLLQESYLGKIKMIYIDPPYNTGNDFIYNDDFKMENEEYKDVTGEVDENGNRMFKNSETNGRYHSDWCSMIYSRLKLAHNLLSDNGVIFISIDDNEQENLKKICNEVFGEGNFYGQLIQLKGNTQNDAKKIQKNHEYILVYSKNNNDNLLQYYNLVKKEIFEDGYYLGRDTGASSGADKLIERPNLGYTIYYFEKNSKDVNEKEMLKWINSKKSYSDFKILKNDKKIIHAIALMDYSIDKIENNSKEENLYSNNKELLSKGYNIIRPPKRKGGKLGRWTWGIDTFKEYWNNNEVLIKNNKNVIKKEYVDDEKIEIIDGKKYYTKNSLLPIQSIIDITNSEGTSILSGNDGLIPGISFSNPKNPKLIEFFIDSIKKDEDYIVLDFFSGSATTAHAIFEYNVKYGRKCKFIMVQLDEKIDSEKDINGNIFNNICEIGKERIRRAGKKILEENKDKENIKNLDIGFRVLKLDDSNMKDVYYHPEEYTQDLLSKMTSNIKEDRTEDDLLFASLIERGVPLNKSYRKEKMDNHNVIIYNEEGEVPEFIACFDNNVSEKVCEEIAKMKPLKAVFRDSSFGKSSDKINIEEIFKMYSPDTKIKVM